MALPSIANNLYNFYLPLLAIVLLAAALVLALDCIWRVEKRLATFMKLFLGAVSFFLAKKILEIAGFSGIDFFSNFFGYLDLGSALFLLCAAMEMYKIIRRLDGENPQKNK